MVGFWCKTLRFCHYGPRDVGGPPVTATGHGFGEIWVDHSTKSHVVCWTEAGTERFFLDYSIKKVATKVVGQESPSFANCSKPWRKTDGSKVVDVGGDLSKRLQWVFGWGRYALGYQELISTAEAVAPGCHCCAAVEEPPSVGCKEDGVKAQRQGLGNWRCWLGPLGCLQHRLQMSASYHLTDALSWLQSISYCTSLYITALRGQPALAAAFSPVSPPYFFKPLPSPGFKKPKPTKNPTEPNLLSTTNLIGFNIKSEPHALIGDVGNPFIDLSFSVREAATLSRLVTMKPNDDI